MNIPERFLPPRWTAAVVLLCAPACINVPAVEPTQAEVRITSPGATAYTNGVVEVRLDVTGHTPDRVELLKDGEVLTELAPPYVYTWDTAGEAEGTYRLEARAALGDVAYTSVSREVVVDRTPPQVVTRVPEPGAKEVWVQSPIRAEFSEPVKRSSVTTESVHLTVGDVAVAHAVTLSEDGKTVTVAPVTQFTAPSTVALAFSGTVTDLAGNAAVNLGEAWSWAVPEFVPYPFHSLGPDGGHRWTRPYIKVDLHGNPVVLTWGNDNITETLTVTRWTGSSWEQLGANLKTSPSDYSIDTPTLQVSASGVIFVAWKEDIGAEFNNYIHIAQWTGDRWNRLGGDQGILPEQPHAWDFSMRLTTQGHPVIAVDMDAEAVDGGKVHVYQWAQEQWQRIGSPLKGDSESSTSAPFLELDENNNPVVAFGHKDGEGKIFVWRWANNDWERLGTTPNSDNEHYAGNTVSLAFIPFNQPVISWTGYRPPLQDYEFFIKTWSDLQWTPIAPPPRHSATGSRAVAATHFTPGHGLLVASTEYENNLRSIHLNLHKDNQWGSLWNTREALAESRSTGMSLSMDASSPGGIVLAWTEKRNEQQAETIIYRQNK